MGTRNLAVLFLVVVALGAFIFVVERDLPSTDERKEQAKKVLTLEQKDVTAVSIAWDEIEVQLEKRARDRETDEPAMEWWLAAPLEARADRYAVERLVSSLTDLEKKRELEDVQLEEYGLAPPEIQVTLVDDAQLETILAVGAKLPASDDRVVTLGDGADAFVVPGSFVGDLKKEPGEWRSRELFPGERAQVERIRLQFRDQEVLLGRRGQLFWVEAPFVDLADQDAANEVLTVLTGLQAKRFVDQASPEEVAAMGLVDPVAVVEVVLADQETPIEIRWGSPVPDQEDTHYVQVDLQRVETVAALGPILDRAPQLWRSLRWTSLEAYELESVTIEIPGEAALELAREEGDWLRTGEKLPYAQVSDFLYALTGAKAEQVRAHDQIDPGDSDAIFQVVLADDEGRTEELTLYQLDSGLVGKVSGRDVTLRFAAELQEEVESKLQVLLDPEPAEGNEE